MECYCKNCLKIVLFPQTKTPATRGQAKQAKLDKKSKDEEEMDVGTYPPNWQSPRRTPRRTAAK